MYGLWLLYQVSMSISQRSFGKQWSVRRCDTPGSYKQVAGSLANETAQNSISPLENCQSVIPMGIDTAKTMLNRFCDKKALRSPQIADKVHEVFNKVNNQLHLLF